MSSISNALEKGFLKYYNTITKLGYIDRKSVNNLIVASWINDVLEGKYGFIVNDEQYLLLSYLYMCIEGNCLVPYQKYCGDLEVNVEPDNRYVRMTESLLYNTERLLENDNLKMI